MVIKGFLNVICLVAVPSDPPQTVILYYILYYDILYCRPVAPVAQRYHVTSDTLGREFDPGKRDFSH